MPADPKRTREVRVGAELVDRLEAEAGVRGLSTSWFTSKLLAEALEKLKPVEEFTLLREPDDE